MRGDGGTAAEEDEELVKTEGDDGTGVYGAEVEGYGEVLSAQMYRVSM